MASTAQHSAATQPKHEGGPSCVEGRRLGGILPRKLVPLGSWEGKPWWRWELEEAEKNKKKKWHHLSVARSRQLLSHPSDSPVQPKQRPPTTSVHRRINIGPCLALLPSPEPRERTARLEWPGEVHGLAAREGNDAHGLGGSLSTKTNT